MSGLFVNLLLTSPWDYISWVVIIVFSICVHEMAHAWTALRHGDDTAARAGHLTLNPMVQMGLQSMIVLALFGIAWGAAPFNPARLDRAARSRVAFSGPAANLALAVVFSGLTALSLLAFGPDRAAGMTRALATASRANATLFLFNMLPLPMLDGWAVLAGFFPSMDGLRARLGAQVNLIFLLVMFLTPAFSLVWRGGHAVAVTLISLWARLVGLGG